MKPTSPRPALACTLLLLLASAPQAGARGWNQLAPSFSSPRYDHAMAFDIYNSRIVLFGGNDGTNLYADTWIFSPAPGTWAQGPSAPAGLTARSRHAMEFRAQGSVTILFGGIDGTGPRDDMWAFDGSAWTQMTPGGALPSARGNHAMVYDSNRGTLVLFGGWDGAYFDDTWLFNGAQWLAGPAAPPGLVGRDSHAMTFDAVRDRAVLFGGWDGATALNDTWEYDPNAATWSLAAGAPAGLTARTGAFLAIEPRTGRAVLFGGFDGTSYLGDTWLYDGTSWTAGPASNLAGRAGHRMAPTQATGMVILCGGQDAAGARSDTWEYVDNTDDYLVGAGLGAPNPNRVQIFATGGAPTSTDFSAYGAGQWGVNVASGNIDGGATDAILTGPGPGPVFGPQVRAFKNDGSPLAKVNYYAYGTLKFGVNLTSQQTDGDAFSEIQTGAGPGDVFGPHVRGWNYDGAAIAPITKVNFFAYSTLKYGVNLEGGDLELDNYAELVTGPGPGSVFGPVVRGFNIDGGNATSIAKINFLAHPNASQYGANVAAGDLDLDSFAEITCSLGPGPTYRSEVTGFNFDGVSIAALANFPILAFVTNYGGRVGLGDVGDLQSEDIIVAAGRDPAAPSTVKSYSYKGGYPFAYATDFEAFPTPQLFYGANVATGHFQQ